MIPLYRIVFMILDCNPTTRRWTTAKRTRRLDIRCRVFRSNSFVVMTLLYMRTPLVSPSLHVRRAPRRAVLVAEQFFMPSRRVPGQAEAVLEQLIA